MPFNSSALGTRITVIQKLLTLLGADNADFVVLRTIFTAGIDDGVDM